METYITLRDSAGIHGKTMNQVPQVTREPAEIILLRRKTHGSPWPFHENPCIERETPRELAAINKISR